MTSDATVEARLDELLAETPGEAARRVAESPALTERDAIALYGAGTLGRSVLAKLRSVGVEPAAFVDDTPEKQGSAIDGLPVTTPKAFVEEFGDRALFAVTIMNQALRFTEARRRLTEAAGARVVSFLDVAWQYPDVFLPYYHYELPQSLLRKSADIRLAFQAFEDEQSRGQFVDHLRFRLHRDYDALPARSRSNYFPEDVPLQLSADTTFVDCGAYDGDTIRHFLAHQRGRFREIHAFEPDAENCRRLRAYSASLGADADRRIHIHQAGVGERRARMPFHSTGDMSAAFASGGEVEVDIVAVQDVVAGGGSAVYVKYDVEGHEWDALEGTRALIESDRPTLAVSVYHRPDDLWLLPLHLRSLHTGYRLFLRTEGEDGTDVICYAVPSEAGGRA